MTQHQPYEQYLWLPPFFAFPQTHPFTTGQVFFAALALRRFTIRLPEGIP
jgi:hypothetical protein